MIRESQIRGPVDCARITAERYGKKRPWYVPESDTRTVSLPAVGSYSVVMTIEPGSMLNPVADTAVS